MILCCSFFFCQSLNGSPVKFDIFTLWNASEVTILELERCGFLHFEVYLVSDNFLFLFFRFFFFLNFQKLYFFTFFLKRIRCSKYKQQGIVKVLISYQMQNLQCSFYKITTCEAFSINTKILSFLKKLENYASYKKKSRESKHCFSSFYISLPNFKAFGSIIKKNLKLNRSP